MMTMGHSAKVCSLQVFFLVEYFLGWVATMKKRRIILTPLHKTKKKMTKTKISNPESEIFNQAQHR
jgi:hypothetical protein